MMKPNAMEKKSKPKPVERKSGKIANGILRKQSLLNNNNIVKNLNDKPKKGTPGPRRRVAPPEAAVPPLPQGCTPLMYACQQADEKLVAEILKKEPGSVLKRDRTLKTALHYCFDNPTAATADRITMAAPALLEARDQDGFTPLHLAVIQGNMPLVTFLLANNSDVMALDNEKHSVVHWATVCGELEALRAVLSAGADPSTADIHGGYPLHYAAQMCGSTASGSARLSLEVLGALLRANTRVDVTDGQGRQPLLWASSAGSAPAILALVKAGAAVEAADKDGLTALHCAASRGHTECIETLLTLCGARPDVIDSNGCTALHYAVTLGHADATVLLLDHESDPNRQDRKGRSPAHCGCAKGQLETVRMLGARGANVWLRNAKGDLPLHEAVASGRRELVKWLLEMRPSQINATNNDGRTLLHIAANTDNTDLCKILLDFGAQVNAVLRTSKNILMTPLDCALHKGYRSTAKYLQMHGGLPASRLASRQVMVNQESVPQLPVRHIKSTKINLRDNIAIEKREIFEMSPCSTPKHKYSGKIGGSMATSSEYSSEEYELDSKRLEREKRRRAKKHSQLHKKEKLISAQNSFSDGYESENLEKSRSSRKAKTLSESESSGNVYKRKSKRSKSEPSDPKTEKISGLKKHKKIVNKSSESDVDKKYKKRRKTATSKKASRSNSPSEDSNDRKERKSGTHKTTEKTVQELVVNDGPGKENESSIRVNEIIEKIENNIQKLDNVIESRMSENETNVESIVRTTLITEAQVHAESQDSPDKISEEKIIAVIQEDAIIDNEDSSKSVVRISETVEIRDFVKSADLENESVLTEEPDAREDEAHKKESDTNENEMKFVEHHAEIQEEKVESEILDQELEIRAHDSIIAIIPDTDMNELNASEDMNEENRAILEKLASQDTESNKEDESIVQENNKPEEYVQAIIGILPDDDEKLAGGADAEEQAEESPDSVMGEPVEVNFEESPNTLTLIDGERPGSESKNFRIYTPERLVQQDSEEISPGIEEMSLKPPSEIVSATIVDADQDFYDEEENLLKSKDKGIQKVFPDTKIRKTDRKSSVQYEDVEKPTGFRRSSDSKRKEMYETESYKVLPDGSSQDVIEERNRERSKSLGRETDINLDIEEPDRFVKQASYTRRRMPSVSDNEMYSIVDSSGTVRRRRLKKKFRDKSRSSVVRSKSQNSDREYESSFFVDSGFEPSPRVVYQNRMMSPSLAAYYEDRNATGVSPDKITDSKIPKRKPGDKNAVDMTSVTQIVQTNMRRYFLERKIFQYLMDLKRIQIRSSKAHEAVLVKRAIDEYHKSSLAYVGAGRYTSNEFTYKSFEKFLYDSLRKLQRSSAKHLINLPERAYPDFDGNDVYKMDGLPDNPILCTSKTHRCFHAVHAYTGIPCSAYIPPKVNHHTMPKPGSKKQSGFLPKINNKAGRKQNSQVTLELCHGNEKQMISLPAEKLDKNKRYYVTFTVKGSNPNSDNENKQMENTQRNVKSV